MSEPHPVITGVGLVTPLGRSIATTWQALLDGHFIADHTRLSAGDGASVPRVTSIAIEAATEAVGQAGWPSGGPAAIVGCTSKGPIECWMAPAVGAGGGAAAGLHADDDYGMASPAAAVGRHLGIGPGPRLTVSAACAGGLQALGRAAMLIRSGEADRVLVVAAEASVHPLFIQSFRRLGVLPAEGQLCRPYDIDRQGFLMSEAAAAVCLERPAGAVRPAMVAVDGYGTGADATHLTGVDRTGLILRRLLQPLATDGPFDLVHGHGTGTELNDAAELSAFAAALPNEGAAATLYSHKGALGHTLGASGLVAAVLNVMCHRDSVVPPNVNTRWPMTTNLRLDVAAHHRPVRRSVVCAAGFGGGVTAVRLATA